MSQIPSYRPDEYRRLTYAQRLGCWISANGGRDGYPIRNWSVYGETVFEYLDGTMCVQVPGSGHKWLTAEQRIDVYRDGRVEAEAD